MSTLTNRSNTVVTLQLDINSMVPLMLTMMVMGIIVALMVNPDKQKGNLVLAKGRTPWTPRISDARSVTGGYEGRSSGPKETPENRVLRKYPDAVKGAQTDLIAAINDKITGAGRALEKAKDNASHAHNHYIEMMKRYKLTVWPPTSKLHEYPGLLMGKKRAEFLTAEADRTQIFIFRMQRDRTSAINGGVLSHPYEWYFTSHKGENPEIIENSGRKMNNLSSR